MAVQPFEEINISEIEGYNDLQKDKESIHEFDIHLLWVLPAGALASYINTANTAVLGSLQLYEFYKKNKSIDEQKTWGYIENIKYMADRSKALLSRIRNDKRIIFNKDDTRIRELLIRAITILNWLSNRIDLAVNKKTYEDFWPHALRASNLLQEISKSIIKTTPVSIDFILQQRKENRKNIYPK